MEELLALARQLRPAVLDDHGLLPALHSQVRDFADQTGIQAAFNVRGPIAELAPEQQLVVYRVTQESLSNVAQHSGASKVDVELSFVGRHGAEDHRRRRRLRPRGARAGSGCRGCASARCWSAGICRSGPARATEREWS